VPTPPAPPPATITVNVVAEPLTGIVMLPDTLPPAPPLAPFMAPPPPAPFIVKLNVVTPAGTVSVCVPAVAKLTVAYVVPWNEELVLVQLLPAIALTV
jgi:hypothetical protein